MTPHNLRNFGRTGCATAAVLADLLIGAATVLGSEATSRDPLARHVTIYRDEYGVPHFVGATEAAAFFGYGYAQAEDHLERMMLQYRDAQGRRAEIQGAEALGDGYLHFIPYEYRAGLNGSFSMMKRHRGPPA
jgi:acyl-homoserine lactone acylase PvdQ